MTAKWLTPVVTAFDKNGQVDYEGNKHIYDFLINSGINGIVILGSTGEFYSLSMEQRKELIKFAVEYIDKRTTLLVGTGDMSVEETIELSNYAHDVGADGVLVVSPYYFNLSKESIEAFYDKVAEGTKANIYIYNFPARTGYDIPSDVTLKLVRKHKNIVGYKDSVSEMGHTRDIITTVCSEFPDFEVYSGFDENFIHNVISGGAGAIGGLSNFMPDVCMEWVKAFNEKDLDKICEIQKVINQAMEIYEIGIPFIPIIKKAMVLRGIQMEEHSIFPFLQASEEQTRKIKELMEKLNLL